MPIDENGNEYIERGIREPTPEEKKLSDKEWHEKFGSPKPPSDPAE